LYAQPEKLSFERRADAMRTGTIVFVHGTGVRLKGYERSFADAKNQAKAVGIKAEFEECPWGDPLGIEFEGLSLPDPP
jgi:hypothetical protein